MSDMTAQEVITASYRKIGIISPNAQKLADGLQDLQNMLSSWSIEGLMIPNYTTEIFTLSQGKSIYSIGESGSPDFSTVRPSRLINAFFRITNNDWQVNVNMTEGEYHSLHDKTLEIRPTAVWYDPQYPNAYLRFNSEADSALALHLTSEKIIVNPQTLGTAFSIPLEYNEAIVYNLAVRLTPDKNTEVHASVAVMAQISKSTIENYNAIDKLAENVTLDRAIVNSRNSMNYKRGF